MSHLRNNNNTHVIELESQKGTYVHDIVVEKNDSYVATFVAWNMQECEHRITITLQEHAQADIALLIVGHGSEQGSIDVVMHHTEQHSQGSVSAKTVLAGKAHCRFQGMIKIDPTGKHAQSYLQQDVLLLSSEARSWGKPQLEIHTNEVQASHGATVGRVDDTQLFYLQSRGLDTEQAQKVIVQSFMDRVLQRIPESLTLEVPLIKKEA